MATIGSKEIVAGLNAHRFAETYPFNQTAADLEIGVIEEIGALLIVIGAACEDETVYRHHIKQAVAGVETLLALAHVAARARL